MQTLLKISIIITIIIFSLRVAVIDDLTPGTVVFIIMCVVPIMIGNLSIYIITAVIASFQLFESLLSSPWEFGSTATQLVARSPP